MSGELHLLYRIRDVISLTVYTPPAWPASISSHCYTSHCCRQRPRVIAVDSDRESSLSTDISPSYLWELLDNLSVGGIGIRITVKVQLLAVEVFMVFPK